MKTYSFIKSAVASEIMQLPKISFDYSQDNECTLLDHIESNGYCQPSEIGTTAVAYDLLWSEMARNTDYETPDFSNCTSAFECIEAEGQAILNAAYDEATQEIAKDISNAIDECFGYDFGELELSAFIVTVLLIEGVLKTYFFILCIPVSVFNRFKNAKQRNAFNCDLNFFRF